MRMFETLWYWLTVLQSKSFSFINQRLPLTFTHSYGAVFPLSLVQVDALRVRLEEKEQFLTKKSKQLQDLNEEKSTLTGEIRDMKDMLDVKERKIHVLQKKVLKVYLFIYFPEWRITTTVPGSALCFFKKQIVNIDILNDRIKVSFDICQQHVFGPNKNTDILMPFILPSFSVFGSLRFTISKAGRLSACIFI